MAEPIYGMGWVPSLPDHRDRVYSAPRHLLEALPPKFSLRSKMPPVWNQGSLGSCTSQALGADCQYTMALIGKERAIMPARLFLYYNARAIEGTTQSDAGAAIRDIVKAAVKWGYPSESKWPYRIARFAEPPPSECYTEGTTNLISQYQAVPQDVDTIKACIVAGRPVIVGVSVYDSFMDAEASKTGIVPWPKRSEKLRGGHAILVIGWDDTYSGVAPGHFECRGSWGKEFGDAGHHWLPYRYLTTPSLSSDFWRVDYVI